MWKTIRVIIAFGIVWTAAWTNAFPSAGLLPVPGPLAELLRETDAQNEGLRRMEAEIEALLAEVPAAGALDDPMLTLGVNALPTDTFSFSQEPMTQKQVILAQKFPWFGKLDLASQKAALDAVKKMELLRGKRLELRRSVADAYFELAFVDRSLAVNHELNQMVGQILRIAEATYASGRGLQQDIFQAQIEMGKLIDEKATLEDRRRRLVDRIHEWVHSDLPVDIHTGVALELPALDLSQEALLGQALANHPVLGALGIDIERARLDVELAKKAYYPDMNVQIGYGQREEDLTGRDLPDFVSGAVTVNIPIWFRSKQDKRLDAALSRRLAAERAYEEFRKRLPHQVDAVLSEIRTLRENHHLFDEALLVQSEQWAQASMAAYAVGKVDFDTMMAARLRRIRFGLQADRYRFSVFQALARLEELTALAMPRRPETSEGTSGDPNAGTPELSRTMVGIHSHPWGREKIP